MSKLATLILALTVTFVGTPPSEAQSSSQDSLRTAIHPGIVVARVEGQEITLGEFMVRFAALPQGLRDRYLTQGNLEGFLEDTVANVAVAQEGSRLGVEDDPLFDILMKIRKEEVLRDLYARRTVLSQIDDEDLEVLYRERAEDYFVRPARRELRLILVTEETGGREATEALRREILDGADFASVAQRESADESAGQGGYLGWKERSDLIEGLAEVAFSIPPGELSEVVETELGWHLLKVDRAIPAGRVPFSLVKEVLFQEAVGQRALLFAQSARDDREAVVEKSRIVTYPEHLPW